MNTITNALSVTQAIPDTSTAGGTESSAAGAFSQLLAQFSPAATAPATVNGTATPASGDGINAGTLPSMPSMKPAEMPTPAYTDDANDTPAVDASLVAALLGQMQAPYALLQPVQPAAATTTESAGMAASLVIAGTPSDGAATTHINASTRTAPSEPPPWDAAPLAPADFADDAVPLAARATRPELPAPVSAANPNAADAASRLSATAIAAMTSAQTSAAAIPAPTTPGSITLATDTAARSAVIDPIAAASLAQAAVATASSVPAQPSLASRNDTSNPEADGKEAPTISGVDRARQAHANGSQPFAQRVATLDSTITATESEPALIPPSALAAGGALQKESQVFVFNDKNILVGDVSASGFALPAAPAKDTAGVPQLAITPHLESPEWKPAFASSVKVLVDDGISAATLQLNPVEFGPIDVRIVMNDKRADVTFLVSNPDANAAMQSALPELREQLARSGIQLGQTSVGAHAQDARQPGDTPRRRTAASPDAIDAAGAVPPAGALARARPTSQIDTFA